MPTASPLPRRSRRKLLAWSFLALFLLPVLGAAGALAYHGGPTHWSRWDRSVTSRLADAAATPEARVLVMAGRTRGWKGAVALHSWIAIKRANGEWRRYDVAGWGDPVRLNWWPPDLWFGSRGDVLVDLKGPAAEALIPKIEAAIKSDLLEQVIEAIEKSANTGKIGDGKIFVFDLEQVIRIRTGETGAEAL